MISLETIVTIMCSVLASSGLWTFILKVHDKKDAKTKMILGIGHDRIIKIGTDILERGNYITEDEYENLHDYLYLPYKELGGNGSAERIMQEIDKLHIVKTPSPTPSVITRC